jgi:hypothetical protein
MDNRLQVLKNQEKHELESKSLNGIHNTSSCQTNIELKTTIYITPTMVSTRWWLG